MGVNLKKVNRYLEFVTERSVSDLVMDIWLVLFFQCFQHVYYYIGA